MGQHFQKRTFVQEKPGIDAFLFIRLWLKLMILSHANAMYVERLGTVNLIPTQGYG